jgi:hypothetical protein
MGCKDPYGACVTASSAIAQSVATGMQQTFNLQKQGIISPQEESNILDYFEFANKADATFLTCAQEAHTNGSKAGTYTGCATTFNTSLNNPTQLALIHVSNSTATQDISLAVNTLIAGITTLEAALGGS